jgi:hypothetical protein
LRVVAGGQVEVRGLADRLLAAKELVPVSPPAIDPGNRGQVLVLAVDPKGRLGGCQVLVVADGTTRRVHTILVPGDLDDPLAAVAWSYTDTTHHLARPSYPRLLRRA